MILYHYHTNREERCIAGRTVPAGALMCHVFSSSNSTIELRDWAQRARLPRWWLQTRPARVVAGEIEPAFPHFDLWGRNLGLCGPGVENRVLAIHLATGRTDPAHAHDNSIGAVVPSE